MIPDEAVEAAHKAWREQAGTDGTIFEYNLRAALEAAAPHMSDAEDDLLATVWTQAYHAGFQEAAGFGPTTNPYRSQS